MPGSPSRITASRSSGVMPRFNQGRAAGCVDAEFTVPDGLPPELRVGLFAQPKTYRARIRFAHATSKSRSLPTVMATSFTSASAIAHCNDAIRKLWRSRRRPE